MSHHDWNDIFSMTMPALELVLRGSVMYWFLFLVFRLILRRDVGSMGITDFLFVVLLGDAAQNGMIGEATSATDAVVLISTLVFWNVLIDWATYPFPAVERLFAAQRLCLVRHGRRHIHAQRQGGLAERFAGGGVEDDAFEAGFVGILGNGLCLRVKRDSR